MDFVRTLHPLNKHSPSSTTTSRYSGRHIEKTDKLLNLEHQEAMKHGLGKEPSTPTAPTAGRRENLHGRMSVDFVVDTESPHTKQCIALDTACNVIGGLPTPTSQNKSRTPVQTVTKPVIFEAAAPDSPVETLPSREPLAPNTAGTVALYPKVSRRSKQRVRGDQHGGISASAAKSAVSRPADPSTGQILPDYSAKTFAIYHWEHHAPTDFTRLSGSKRKWKERIDQLEADNQHDGDAAADEWEFVSGDPTHYPSMTQFYRCIASTIVVRAKRAYWSGLSWDAFVAIERNIDSADKARKHASYERDVTKRERMIAVALNNDLRLAILGVLAKRLCNEIWLEEYNDHAADVGYGPVKCGSTAKRDSKIDMAPGMDAEQSAVTQGSEEDKEDDTRHRLSTRSKHVTGGWARDWSTEAARGVGLGDMADTAVDTRIGGLPDIDANIVKEMPF